VQIIALFFAYARKNLFDYVELIES